MEENTAAPEGQPVDNAVAPVAPAPAVPAVPSGFNIPQEYAQEGCITNFKNDDGTLNVDNLVKSFVNQSKVIGKKTVGIPDWNNQQEADDFLSKLRPEDKTKYALPETLTPEQKEITSSMMHEAGLSEYQAKKLSDLYFKDLAETQEKLYGTETFKSMVSEVFKDDKKLAEIHNDVKSLFGEQFIDKADNNTLVEVYKGMAKIKEQYGVKELSANINNPASMASASIEEINSKIKESLGKLEALSARNHTAAEKKVELDNYNKLMADKFRAEGRLK